MFKSIWYLKPKTSSNNSMCSNFVPCLHWWSRNYCKNCWCEMECVTFSMLKYKSASLTLKRGSKSETEHAAIISVYLLFLKQQLGTHLTVWLHVTNKEPWIFRQGATITLFLWKTGFLILWYWDEEELVPSDIFNIAETFKAAAGLLRSPGIISRSICVSAWPWHFKREEKWQKIKQDLPKNPAGGHR